MLRTALTLSLLALPLAAQDDCRLPELLATDAAAVDWYGAAVDVDGTTTVVGALFDDDFGSASGSVYVYALQGGAWQSEGKLLAADGEALDFFGGAVAISGDTLVVGARFEDQTATDAGAAYVFSRSGGTWTQAAKLLASDGAADDRFGSSVAIDGDRIAVGAETHDSAASNAGAVYVFERAGGVWSETAKLTETAASADDYLGVSVALDGDRLVAGANGDDAAGTGAGSAVVFDLAGGSWSQTVVLLADDPRVQGRFGDRVALEGDTIVCAAPLDDDGVFDSGSVYVFELVGGTWTRVAKLRAPAPAIGDEFGRGVALAGETILVGAPYQDDHAANGGNLFQFERVGGVWQFADALLLNAPAAGDRIGTAVAATARFVVAGTPVDDAAGIDAGAVHTFANPGARRPYGTGVAGTVGVPQVATTGCVAVELAQDFFVTNGPPGGVGLLVVGGNAAMAPFATGFVLVAPMPFLVFGHVLDGTGAYTQPFQTTATFTGRSLHFQVGYVDAGAPGNVALSAAVELAFR